MPEEKTLNSEELITYRDKLLEVTRDDNDIPGWNQRLAKWAVDKLGLKPQSIQFGHNAEGTAHYIMFQVQSHQMAPKLREALA
jgi:hypothetical protein